MVKSKNQLKTLIIILFITIIFSSCTTINQNNNNDDNNNLNIQNTQLKKFTSQNEIKEYISNIQNQRTNYNSLSRTFTNNVQLIENDQVDTLAKGSSESTTQKAEDYSKTNIQVKGVDEADIVKNDGKYIYTISNNNLIIIDAYPIKNSKILSKIKFSEKPKEIFINKNKTIIFTQGYKKTEKVSNDNFIPSTITQTMTNIYVYDTKNKTNPNLLENYSITGNYYDSRMINKQVYIISKNNLNYYKDYIGIPEIYNKNSKIAVPDVYYFDNPFNEYNFHTIASLDLSNNNIDINAKTFMLGDSNTLYVTKNNIYIAYEQYYSYNKLKSFKEAILPLLPQNTQKKIKPLINNANYNSDIEWNKITEILENTYNNMQENEKKKLIDEIKNSTKANYEKQISNNQKTIIHKINIENGEIEYDTKGQINGHLLNQFSLDESDNNLRVATTTSYWSKNDGRKQYNNVYILDDDMNQIGKLEELAQDEKIYSTRFIDNKLYIVTFKQIDPLFVIDLENPTNPKILGKLKIPGYSTYLHPFDDNHLIGIGHSTKESEWGGVVNNGVKLSLFDISDFKNPKEVDNYIVKGRYTDSIALHEHKAFLFNKDKNLIVMPVREYIQNDNSDYSRYNRYKMSAFVFNITEKGFDLRGKITHKEDEKGNNYWNVLPSSVQRSLFMDNILYTISERKVMANNLTNLNLIKELDLDYKKEEPIVTNPKKPEVVIN